MNLVPLIVAAVGCVALFVAIWVALAPGGGGGGLSRLDEQEQTRSVPSQTTDELGADAVRMLRARLQTAVGARIDKSKGGSKMADKLARADLQLRPAEWILASAGVSALVGVLVALRFGSLILVPVGFGVGWVLCGFFLRLRQARRQKAFDQQLGSAILSISGGMKAGYTFGQAIDLVSKNAPPPMGSELARITREVQLGVPLVEALGRMVHRNDSEDLRLMLTAVQIQQQVGGNLAEILDTIEFTIRERIRIKGEIKTITSQARVSGYILIGLPFALGGILSMLAPSYFTPMLHQMIGQIMLGVGGFFLLCGYGIIRKIVNVRI
ncbi:MAG TPA: type II secretion system F family protein [Candidatus Dormibacteraeota bacterium]